MKLIHIQIKIRPLVLRSINTTHRRHLNSRNDHKTKKLGIQSPQLTFRQINKQDFLLIHTFTNIKSRLSLPNRITHYRIRNKRPEFTREIRNHLLPLTITRIRILMIPERFHNWIRNFGNLIFHKLIIRKHPRHIDKRRPLIFILHKSQARITKIVLDTRPKDFITKNLNKNLGSLRRRHILLLRSLSLKKIKPHRTLLISRTKHNHIPNTLFRDILQNIFNKITMRINHTNTISIRNILPHNRTDKRRFTSTRLPNNVMMPSSIFPLKPNHPLLSTIQVVTKNNTLFRQINRSRHNFVLKPFDNRCVVVTTIRKVIHRCQFFSHKKRRFLP